MHFAMRVATAFLFAFGLALVTTAGRDHAQAAEIRGLLIGVDAYRNLPRLTGSAADARDLEASLRSIGARDLRVLLDESATRGSILVAFQDLVTRTQAGDTVFITLSGHGAQEPERVKGSEPDGMDEVFLLPAFDPKDRLQNGEKILDKEFKHVIKLIEDKGGRVVFVADTCSGGGLAREVDPRGPGMVYRSVKYTPIVDDLQPISTRADALMSPADFKSSTFLAAVDKQSKVPEIRIPGVGQRGALSYAVARGLQGAADLDGDGAITAAELSEYARRVTYQLSDQRQRIVAVDAPPPPAPAKVIVRGIAVRPVAAEGTAPEPAAKRPAVPPPQADAAVRPASAAKAPQGAVLIASLDGRAERFAGLSIQTAFQVVEPGASPDLVWDPASRDVLAGGDVIARTVDRNDLPSIVERAALLRWLKQRAPNAPQSIRIVPDDRLHRKGSRVEVEIGDVGARGLVIFNVAGDGTVQLLYPIGSDPPVRSDAQYRLQLQVREPFGADQIVVVSSPRRLPDLEQALRQLDRRRSPMKVMEALNQAAGTDSRIGSAGLFTAP